MKTPDPDTFDSKDAILQRLHFFASRGRPCVPDLDTVEFTKEHSILEHKLQYITFKDAVGQKWYFTCFLNQRSNGSWFVQSSSGSREHERVKRPIINDRPWLYLQGGSTIGLGNASSVNNFHAGGEVIDNGFHITRVRLISSDGSILDDTVEDGLVLFWSNQAIHLPVQAELYNSSDELVIKQAALEIPSLLPDQHIKGRFQTNH